MEKCRLQYFMREFIHSCLSNQIKSVEVQVESIISGNVAANGEKGNPVMYFLNP